MKIDRLKSFFKENNLIENFLIFSPFLDIFLSLFNKLYPSLFSAGVIIRGLILLYLLIYLFSKYPNSFKDKKINIWLILIFYYFIVFLTNILLLSGIITTIKETISLFKFFYFPLMIITLIFYTKDKPIKNLEKLILLISGIYIFIFFIAQITGTALDTYSSNKAGLSAWFNSANEFGAILAIISPFLIHRFFNTHNFWFYLYTAIYIYYIFLIGTKVPVMGLILSIIIISVLNNFYYIQKKYNMKEYYQKLIFLLVIIPIIAVFFNPEFNNNFIIQSSNFDKKHSDSKIVFYDEKYNFPKKEIEEYSIYKENKYLNILLSGRDKYLFRKIQQKKNHSLYMILFGTGNNQEINYEKNKLVEMDFVDVLFNYGLFGFFVYFFGLFIFIKMIFIKIFRQIKNKKIDSSILAPAVSVIVGLIISLISGHVIGAPSVSIFIAINLVYLSNRLKITPLSKQKKINKKYLYYFIIAISILLIATFYFNKWNQNQINENIKINLVITGENIKTNQKLHIKKIDEEIKTFIGIEDRNKYFLLTQKGKKILALKLTTRKLISGNNIVFINIKNLTRKNLDIKIKNSVNKKMIFSKRFKKDEVVPGYSNFFGINKTTLPLIYEEFNDGSSMLISKSYIYKDLTIDYGGGNNSLIKELLKESGELKDNNIIFNIPPNYKADTYYIVSSKKLFKNKEDIKKYIYLNNTKISNVWLSYNGPNVKLQYSIEPYTRDGYGSNIGLMFEKEYFEASKNGSTIFQDLYQSVIASYYNYQPRDKSGVWYTNYTSTWLKGKYGTTAFYVDTRHNENFGLHLKRVGEELNNSKLQNDYFLYAEYLVDRYQNKEYIKIGDNFLFPDYFGNSKTNRIPHSSINHQLAIANYLYKAYISTKNKEYYVVANHIINAIAENYNKWIAPNGDLYYARTAKGVYENKDYTTLTLEDLIFTQALKKQIEGEIDYRLNKLINSKISYIEKNKIQVKPSVYKKITEYKQGWI